MNQQATNGPLTRGAHHIGLTVPDLTATQEFFIDTLGYEKVGAIENYPAVFLTDGSIMITLWQALEPDKAIPFDRKNIIGLHHFALIVEDRAALDAMHQRLRNADGTRIEFAPEPLGDGPTRHMMCYIPGGIRVEFIAPAA